MTEFDEAASEILVTDEAASETPRVDEAAREIDTLTMVHVERSQQQRRSHTQPSVLRFKSPTKERQCKSCKQNNHHQNKPFILKSAYMLMLHRQTDSTHQSFNIQPSL